LRNFKISLYNTAKDGVTVSLHEASSHESAPEYFTSQYLSQDMKLLQYLNSGDENKTFVPGKDLKICCAMNDEIVFMNNIKIILFGMQPIRVGDVLHFGFQTAVLTVDTFPYGILNDADRIIHTFHRTAEEIKFSDLPYAKGPTKFIDGNNAGIHPFPVRKFIKIPIARIAGALFLFPCDHL
jgi:hypothetical protein